MRVNVTMSEAEHKAIREAAGKERRKMSAMVLVLAMEALSAREAREIGRAHV